MIHTASGSIWEQPARLAEESRFGAIDGAAEDSFGEITQAVVSEDGSVFLFDAQVPQIYHFNAEGAFLGLVGRSGEGPGEYSERVTGMAIAGGRLLVADAGTGRLGRLSAFSLEGVYQGSLGSVGGFRQLYSPTLVAGPEGGVAVRVLTVLPEPGEDLPTPWPIGLERRDVSGTVIDTIGPQTLFGDPGRVEIRPGDDVVLVGSDSEFLFEIRSTGGEVIRVEMPFERVEFTEAEGRMMGRAVAPVAAADGKSEIRPPLVKRTYLEYLFSPDRRVWARRPIADQEGEPSWRAPLYQPSVMDVFDPDGRYLGVVPLPTNSRPVAVTNTHVYVVELGSFEEPYLVRYRVEVPGYLSELGLLPQDVGPH